MWEKGENTWQEYSDATGLFGDDLESVMHQAISIQIEKFNKPMSER